jgi:ATP-dependent Clp protease adaptor protein ClpS
MPRDVDVLDAPPKMKTVFKTKQPPLWKVMIHNDDYTPAEFVVQVLMEVFKQTAGQAHETMNTAHKTGFALAGIYPREIAETKAQKAVRYAQAAGHPLQVSAEPE